MAQWNIKASKRYVPISISCNSFLFLVFINNLITFKLNKFTTF